MFYLVLYIEVYSTCGVVLDTQLYMDMNLRFNIKNGVESLSNECYDMPEPIRL